MTSNQAEAKRLPVAKILDISATSEQCYWEKCTPKSSLLFGVPQTIESFFSRKRESWKRWEACHINSFNNNDIGANVEGMQPVMRDYCKNPQNVCRRKIGHSHFGFGIPSARDKHSCCNICRTDCECSECVELHQDVLALENIHILDNEFLLSGKQVKDIKSELIKYKKETV